MAIFQKSVINKHLVSIDSEKINNAYKTKINQMVYKLYELTEEEIKIVEESVK
jgi:hypothetical protein